MLWVGDKAVKLADFTVQEIIDLARHYNEITSVKVSIHNKWASLTLEKTAKSKEFSVLLNGISVDNETLLRVTEYGYVIVDYKLLFVNEKDKGTIHNLISDDIGEQIKAVSHLTPHQISEQDKSAWLEVLDNEVANNMPNLHIKMAIELYDYQKKGLAWLRTMQRSGRGALLADDMGLGKTAQVISFLADGFAKAIFKTVLIVVPNSLLANWAREVAKFTEGLPTYIHWGSNRAGFAQQLKKNPVIITTYSTITNDQSLFEQMVFDVLVCDEASTLKNPESNRTIAVESIERSFTIAITGTPFENSLIDLWSITNIVSKNFLGNQSEFKRRYGGIKLKDISSSDLALIEGQVNEVMLRRLKNEVLKDLPDKIDIHIALTPYEDELRTYERMLGEIKRETSENTLALISHLRKYTAHPYLYSNEILNRSFEDLRKASSKFAHLTTLLDTITQAGDKALIFANHIDLIQAMKVEIARHYNTPCFKIDGTISVEDRQTVIDEFQASKGSAVMVLNPITAGMGLNITAANHVIHFSRQWNPALEEQATARAYRNGQSKSVNAYYLYYAETIEEVIHQRLITKQTISSSIITPTLEEDIDEMYLRILEEF